jgi:hypothetical protein
MVQGPQRNRSSIVATPATPGRVYVFGTRARNKAGAQTCTRVLR